MKKIVFLTWNTKKNGGNYLNFKFSEILSKKGYDSVVVSFLKPENKWPELKTKFCYFPDYLANFVKPDVLFATFWPTAFLASLIPSKKKYYFVRNWEANFYKNPFLHSLVPLTLKLPFDRIITISGFLKNHISAVSKIPIYLIPDPIDIDLYKPRKSIGNSRRPKKIITVVSTYSLFKGMDNLVKVVKSLKEKHPDYYFTLISFEKKSFSDCFDEFISDPSIKTLISYYQKSDLFLSTSLTEGFPLPPREAMACGCPVVTTDSGGINEYGKHNFNCFIEKGPDEILKKRRVEQIVEDQEIRKKFIKNGLLTAKKYSWENSINLLTKIL